MVEVLKVSSKSNPNSVAGALAGVLRQTGAVEVQVVGAGALNQAIKAIAIARGFVAPSNLDLVCIPTFADILIDGQGRTAIRLAVEDRARRKPTEPWSAGRPDGRGRRSSSVPSPATTVTAHHRHRRAPPAWSTARPPSATDRHGHHRRLPGPGAEHGPRPHLTRPARPVAAAVAWTHHGRVVESVDTLALGASASA